MKVTPLSPKLSSTLGYAPELAEFLTKLSCFLLAQGVTLNEFLHFVTRSFADAAAVHSKLANGKVNHSRVAARTGLTRAAVRRLLSDQTQSAHPVDRSPLAMVLFGWRMDRQFQGKSGKPKRLRVKGRVGSFEHLAKKYGRDIPARAILDELRWSGAVIDDGGGVRIRVRMGRTSGRDLARVFRSLAKSVPAKGHTITRARL